MAAFWCEAIGWTGGGVTKAASTVWRLAILGTAFALHNLEEVLRFEAWRHVGKAGPPADLETFVAAVIMLTVIVAAILALAARDLMNSVWDWMAAIIAGGLLVNVASHAVQSIVALAPVPGVCTGLLLVGPAAASALAGFAGTTERAWPRRALALLLGAVAMPVIALTALMLADRLM